jgi:ketosteroid isomerase-like protein
MRRKCAMSKRITLTIITLCLIACTHTRGKPGWTQEALRDSIAASNREYVRLINAGNREPAKLASQFTKDAFLIIPELKLVSGRVPIEQSLAQTVGQVSLLSLETSRVESSGDMAFEVGKWTSTINGGAANGSYLALWRLSGGRWQRAGSCSAPEGRAPALTIREPAAIFGPSAAPRATGRVRSEAVRLIGNKTVARKIAAQIQEHDRRYAEAFNADNESALRSLVSSQHARDAIAILPGTIPFTGPEGISAACGAAMASCSDLAFTLLSVEAGADGDLAFALSAYVTDVRSEAGDVIPTAGHYLAVWKREGEQWRVAGSCTADEVSTPDINYSQAGR